MKSAEEYNKSLGLNQAFRSDQKHVFEFAEEYASYRIEQLLDELMNQKEEKICGSLRMEYLPLNTVKEVFKEQGVEYQQPF